MSKRSYEPEENQLDGNPQKKIVPLLEPLSLKKISCAEDLDTRVLLIQNSNLSMKCQELKVANSELKNQIEEFEKIHKFDQILVSLLCHSINEHDNDVKYLISSLKKDINYLFTTSFEGLEPSLSFIERLTGLSSAMISEEIKNRLDGSMQNTKQLIDAIRGAMSLQKYNLKSEQPLTQLADSFEKKSEIPLPSFNIAEINPSVLSTTKDEQGECQINDLSTICSNIGNKLNEVQKPLTAVTLSTSLQTLNDSIREDDDELIIKPENLSIQINNDEYFKFRGLLREYAFVNDRQAILQQEVLKLQTKIEELTCDLRASLHRYEVLLIRYSDDKLRKNSDDTQVASPEKVEQPPADAELLLELETQKELSNIRLKELEDLQEELKTCKGELERCKLRNMICAKDHNVATAPQFLSMQNQYVLLLADSTSLKEQLDIYRKVLKTVQEDKETQMATITENVNLFRIKVSEEIKKLHTELYETKLLLEKTRNISKLNSYLNSDTRNVADANIFSLLEVLQKENLQLKETVQQIRKKNADLIKIAEINKCDSEGSAEKIDLLESETSAILNEMEILTSSYDDLRSNNINLLQQVHEMETTNLKNISENIRAIQLQKIMKEEKQIISNEIENIKLLEKEKDDKIILLEARISELQKCINGLQHEKNMKNEVDDLHRKKAQEAIQQYALVHYVNEQQKDKIKEYEVQILHVKSELEDENFKVRRLVEEMNILKKKLERAHQNQYAGATDRILLEEVRMLKSKLTCNCCNTKPKDAIITKCFHLFCFDCLATTYNTRQRKCPKCGQSFGNNDFHRLYF